MNSDERSKLYEKLYIHELERKEKINTRLNLPLAISVGLIGLLSFIINNAPLQFDSHWAYLFWFMFSASVISLIFAFYFFKQCWFGHTDQLIPTAKDIEKYYITLQNHYSNYPCSYSNRDKEFKSFLKTSYRNYATKNAINNDERSFKLYYTTVALTCALVFAFFALVPHQLYNIEKNNSKTAKESVTMSNNNQPPPGPRNIRGEVPAKKPPPPTQG